MEAQAAMEQQKTTGTSGGDARGRSGLRAGLTHLRRLPQRLPLRWPLKVSRSGWRRPTLGRPSLPDLVFAAGSACLVVAIVVVLAGPSVERIRARTHEAAVLDNAATVQLAAETFAAAHAGRYPAAAEELLPYLPGQRAPRNPYTGRAATFTGGVGDLTYRSPTGGQDYLIEAWGTGTAQPRLLATLHGRVQEPGD